MKNTAVLVLSLSLASGTLGRRTPRSDHCCPEISRAHRERSSDDHCGVPARRVGPGAPRTGTGLCTGRVESEPILKIQTRVVKALRANRWRSWKPQTFSIVRTARNCRFSWLPVQRRTKDAIGGHLGPSATRGLCSRRTNDRIRTENLEVPPGFEPGDGGFADFVNQVMVVVFLAFWSLQGPLHRSEPVRRRSARRFP